jgi:hypothetical protein
MYSKDALNWRFSRMTRRAGIGHWHAHEGRHTAVSIMSSNGTPLQDISDTVFGGDADNENGAAGGRYAVVTWLVTESSNQVPEISGAMGIHPRPLPCHGRSSHLSGSSWAALWEARPAMLSD